MTTADYITISEACDKLPRKRGGKKVSVKTVSRWIINGCHGTHLAGTKIGNTWYTTEAWLADFFRACSSRTSEALPVGAATASHSMAKRILEQRFGFSHGDKEKTDSLPDLQEAR